MGLFTPTLLRRRITDVTAADLQALTATALLLDVDNTLTLHDSPQLDAAVAEWLAARRAEGLALMIVSNATRERVEPFAARVGLPFVWRAAKPLPFGFWRAARRLGVPRRRCVVIGDQSFTDTLGARLAGISCIQLLPIQREQNKPFLQFKRRLELPILRRYRRRAAKKKRRERV